MAETSDPVQGVLTGTVDIWPGVPVGGFGTVLLKLSGEAFAGGGGLGVAATKRAGPAAWPVPRESAQPSKIVTTTR